MFCPPDHVLIEDVFRRILDRSFAIFPDESDPAEGEDGFEAGYNDFMKHSSRAHSALDFFLNDHPLSICSPEGTVLNVSNRILAQAGGDAFGEGDDRYYECIDDRTWLIDARPWPKTSAHSKDTRAKIVEALLQSKIERAEVFSRFNGWSLSVHSKYVPSEDHGFDPYLAPDRFFDLDEDTEEVTPKSGRPEKVLSALKAYCTKFPNGKGTTVLHKVKSAVEDELGMSCSETTLRRVLRAVDLMDELLEKFGDDCRSASREEISDLLVNESRLKPGDEKIDHVFSGLQAGYPFH